MKNNFEINKKYALIKAIEEQLIEESRAVIAPLALIWPQGAIALTLILASSGVLLKLKQEELNQFTIFIKDNPEVFNEQVVNSKEFQDGLLVFLNSYFKLRSDNKLKLARKIFYDFGKSNEKPLYPIERYNDTLEKISESGLRFLGFINTKIPIIKGEYVDNMIREHSNIGNRDHFYDIYTRNKHLSNFINHHISSQARSFASKQPEVFIKVEQEEQSKLQEKYFLMVSELEQLGLARSFTSAGLGHSATPAYEYDLTDYGNKFISIIKPDYK